MKMKKILIIVFVFTLFVSINMAAFACEFNFTIFSDNGEVLTVRPGSEVALVLGETYKMKVEFVQDHRKCEIPPEATVYLLGDEKWKTQKDYLPLVLIERGEWEPSSSTSYEQELVFIAQERGPATLEVIRECPKGGYDEEIVFEVK
jgi:hypothetical protein